jgi:hypothetical protein
MSDTPVPLPPQSNLPPAIRKQVADANALIAQLNAKPGEIPAGTEFQTMPGSETPGTMPTGQQTRWQPAPPSATAQPQGHPDPATQQPPRAAAPPPPPAAATEIEPWEARYRTLQGKYDAEVRMTREILASQQATMDKLIQDRQSAVAPPPAPPQDPAEFLRSLGVTDKELEDYGEVLPIMARMAQNMIKPTAAKLERELQKTKEAAGTVAKAQMQSGQQSLLATLQSRVPDWAAINEDQNFLAWLDQVDLFSGTSRRVSLEAAFQNLDTARVVGIFEKFVQEDSVRRSTSGPTIDPQTLIAPGVPRGGAAEAPGGAAGKRILSESEIKDFYSRVRRRQVSAEQYAAFSAEIAAATAEGRIKPDRRDHHANS